MKTKDVLITDFVHGNLLTGLTHHGYSWTYAPLMSRKEMEAILYCYKGVVINTRCAIDRNAMASAPLLRWIARLGSGLDIIDLEAAREMGIQVFSAPEGNARAVAEHALGMLLALVRKIPGADRSVRDGRWNREQHRGIEIGGKTIGIIGYGQNGGAFGQLLQGWNVRVLAYDKYLSGYAPAHVEEVTLDMLVRESDIISLHIPLTPETTHMINSTFLNKCKPGTILINTSRGKNINLGEVIDAMKSGQLGGLCIDVFPEEPPFSGSGVTPAQMEILAALENVVLSPHIAGWTVESKRKIADVLIGKIPSNLEVEE